jgi:hypothetical protein
MQIGPVHFNFDVSVADMLVVLGAAWIATRTVVTWLRRNLIDRLQLHEEALIRAGWLRRNRKGELEVAVHVSGRPS